MMENSTLTTRHSPTSGNSLFTTVSIEAGAEIFRVDRPLAYVLDSPNLQTTCANCLKKPSVDETYIAEESLKRCMGCKIVKYCSTVWYIWLRYLCFHISTKSSLQMVKSFIINLQTNALLFTSSERDTSKFFFNFKRLF